MAIYGRVTSHPGELLPAPFQDGHISYYISDSHSASYPKYGRAGGIRTHDLLNPIQAHYQAVLRPDKERGRKMLCARKVFKEEKSQASSLKKLRDSRRTAWRSLPAFFRDLEGCSPLQRSLESLKGPLDGNPVRFGRSDKGLIALRRRRQGTGALQGFGLQWHPSWN